MLKILILAVLATACNSSLDNNPPAEKPNEKKETPKSHTEACLESFGLPESLVKSEIHRFSPDCEFLELTQAAMISSYDLTVSKAAPRNECIEVEQILRKIDEKKSKLTSFQEKKRSLASEDFDSSIGDLEKDLNELESSPVLRKESALVYIKAKLKNRFLMELARMEKAGLTYSLDSEDMGNRVIQLKSYLVKDLDRTVQENTYNRIPNLFYCSLNQDSLKDQTYFEYQGNFNGRPFMDVYSASLLQ